MAKQEYCKHCRRKVKKTFKGNWMHLAGGWKARQPKCPKGAEPGGKQPELKGQLPLFNKRKRRAASKPKVAVAVNE